MIWRGFFFTARIQPAIIIASIQIVVLDSCNSILASIILRPTQLHCIMKFSSGAHTIWELSCSFYRWRIFLNRGMQCPVKVYHFLWSLGPLKVHMGLGWGLTDPKQPTIRTALRFWPEPVCGWIDRFELPVAINLSITDKVELGQVGRNNITSWYRRSLSSMSRMETIIIALREELEYLAWHSGKYPNCLRCNLNGQGLLFLSLPPHDLVTSQ